MSEGPVAGDCLLAVDIFANFDHEDGDKLLASMQSRANGFARVWREARGAHLPIVYANDSFGDWRGNAQRIVDRALAGPAGPMLEPLAPLPEDAFVVKPRYSAFDATPLEILLEELEIDRLFLVGTTTEMCIAQTAIDARERDLKVTVVRSACATVDEELERVALRYLRDVTGTMIEERFTEGAARMRLPDHSREASAGGRD
jgi:nicotinamidase-related amidase